MQRNLDMTGKTDFRFGFSGQKYIEKDDTDQSCISKNFFVTQCYQQLQIRFQIYVPRYFSDCIMCLGKCGSGGNKLSDCEI